MGKRYYWLKLPEDFFRDKKIKRLRRMAGGDTYVNIYLEMMLQSLQTDGILYFEGLEEDFAAEVSLTIDEQEDDVRATIGYLLRVGKLEKKTEWEYVIPDAVKSIGSETAVAERVRRCRAKKQSEALQCNAPETQVKQNGNGEIDIDREIEKDIYLSILDGESKENLSTFQQSAQLPTLSEVKQCSEVLQLLQRTWMENQERSANHKLERHTGLLGQDRRNLSGQAKAGNLCFRECSSL